MIVKFNARGESVEIEFLAEMTVADLKLIVSDMFELGQDIRPEQMELTGHDGTLLRNDADSIDMYNLNEDSTIYLSLLESNSNISQSTAAPLSTSSLGLSQMMDSSMLQQMIFNDPKMQKMFDKNPELRHAFADPAVMKQMLDAASDPEKMLQMQKSNDLALAQLENMPGGFQALTGFYRDIEDTLEMRNPLMNDAEPEEQERRNRMLAQSLGVTDTPKDRINDVPLPNPWSPPPPSSTSSSSFSAFPRFTFPGQNQRSNLMFQPPSVPLVSNLNDYRSRYREQLQAMNDMGFPDTEANLQALIQTNGNVDSAIALILARQI